MEVARFSERLSLIHILMAWNAVYDHHNHRPFTSITRYWIDRKFGGWFVWLDDLFYHGLISLVSGDTEMARENILAALSNACPAGNFACLMSEYTEWVDRSQPPIGAFIVYKYYLYTGDTALLQRALPLFRASIAWWKKCRRTPNGLFAYGSGNLGNGCLLYTSENQTKQAHDRGRNGLASFGLLLPGGGMLALLVAAPLILLIVASFCANDSFSGGFTLANYQQVFADGVFTSLMGKSVLMGLAVTLGCVLLAYPVAYGLAKLVSERARGSLIVLIIIPFFTSQLLLIYSMIVLLQGQGPLMSLLALFGADPSASILYTDAAVFLILLYEFPVSYTHLDVYKRQAGEEPREKGL